MESSSSNRAAEQERQEEIRRQIAILQAQLNAPESIAPVVPSSPKRKESSCLIVPATPSPKKKKLNHLAGDRERSNVTSNHAAKATRSQNAHVASLSSSAINTQPRKSAPSTVLQKLAKAHTLKDPKPLKTTVSRSIAFTDSAIVAASPAEAEDVQGPVRDDRLAIIEDLTPGPIEHKPPFDDPRFEKLEPNSGIRLSSRAIPHEDFQDYIRGRYYLSPSKLYSVVRLLPSKQGYDVPVSGDWLTIAVVAERGKLKYSQAPVGLTHDEKMGQDEDDEASVDRLDISPDGTGTKAKTIPYQGRPKRPKDEPPKPSGKKYVNMKLVDFGCRARSSSAVGGKAIIRGDASLSLLLFESDGHDIITRENGKKEKVYRGGSRGAFEKMSMLKEGAVVALLNPKILKPFQRSGDAPHPVDNILALTPESVGSIAVIGYSQDLGMCKATRRDGTACGSWCDRRVSDVCDWHVQHAVERKRAGRPEFSSGTSGMSTGAKRKKQDYDPAREWGLKPADHDRGGGATYVVSGHVISGSSDTRSLFVSERMGRDAQAKAARVASTREADHALQQLLKRDKAGTKALAIARQFSKKQARREQKLGKGKGKEKTVHNDSGPESTSGGSDGENKSRKNMYSAQLIRQLGFDPTSKDGRKSTDPKLQSKLDALIALQTSRKDVDLAPRPGKRKSCVAQPNVSLVKPAQSGEDSPIHFPDSDAEDDLDKEERSVFGKVVKSSKDRLICLDSSDVELEIQPPIC